MHTQVPDGTVILCLQKGYTLVPTAATSSEVGDGHNVGGDGVDSMDGGAAQGATTVSEGQVSPGQAEGSPKQGSPGLLIRPALVKVSMQ